MYVGPLKARTDDPIDDPVDNPVDKRMVWEEEGRTEEEKSTRSEQDRNHSGVVVERFL